MKLLKTLIPVLSLLILILFPAYAGAQAGPVSKTTAAKPFTATLGLDQFDTYRLNLRADIDGLHQGRPTEGRLNGSLDRSKRPDAQHLRLDMAGEVFEAFAPTGKMEVVDVKNTYYLQHPKTGNWMTMPAFLVDAALPDGVPALEDSIDLPLTATPQPGLTVVDGVVARRYTFGPDDLPPDVLSRYDHIEGTLWVAVEGNYVVRYEATIEGQFDFLQSEGGSVASLIGVELPELDEGTVTVRYDLTEVNAPLTIQPPAGIGGFNLGSFLFGR